MVSTFEELQAQVFERYGAKEYEAALELVNQHGHHFPIHEHVVTLYKMCLAARTDQPSLAAWMLEEALASGEWYAVETLRADDDLALLAGNAEWERLLTVCEEREREALAHAAPVMLTSEPDSSPPWPVLLTLHGSAWNGAGFVGHWRAARNAGFLLAAPQSSQPSGPNRYGWHDRDRATAEITRHLESLRAQSRADLGGLVVSGFSAGATLALELAASGLAPAKAVIAVAPGAIHDAASTARGLAERGVRALLVGGRRDLGRSEALVAIDTALRDAGSPSTLELYDDLAHEFPPDFDAVLKEFLSEI